MAEFCVSKNAVLHGARAIGYLPQTYLWRDDVLEATLRESIEQRLPGKNVSLVNIWSGNYFHWILEQMTVLSVLPKPYRVIIGRNAKTYVLEGLALLGITDIFEWNEKTTKCEQLLSYGPVRVNGHNDELALYSLRAAVGAPQEPELNIYVSRNDATERKVLNEDELDKDDYEVLLLNGSSLRWQIDTFSRAKKIVGPHGAGLVNMVFAPEGCEIVEFFGEYHNPCFENLAHDLGHKYMAVQGKPEGKNIRMERIP